MIFELNVLQPTASFLGQLQFSAKLGTTVNTSPLDATKIDKDCFFLSKNYAYI